MRVVYGEADQLPGLVVDRYGDVLAVQVLTLGMEVRQELIREALEAVLKPRGVMRAADSPLRPLEGLPSERGAVVGRGAGAARGRDRGLSRRGGPLARTEDRAVPGSAAQSPARRGARARVAACSICSAIRVSGRCTRSRGGAASVQAVDSSQAALEAAARNFERNGFGGRIELKRGDAFDTARDLERGGEKFGMVIVDPPALIKSRKHLAAGAKAYREVNRAAMAMLEEEGVLITCSCSHHLEDSLFRQVLIEAARAAHRPMRVLGWSGEGPDHPQLLAVPETHYLKCAVLQAV